MPKFSEFIEAVLHSRQLDIALLKAIYPPLLSLFSVAGAYACASVLSLSAHEAGHIIAARCCGVKVKKIGFCWRGVYLVREAGPLRENLIITLAGPLTNLLLAGLWHWFPLFALVNLVNAVSNLLPFEGADGTRARRYAAQLLNKAPATSEDKPGSLSSVRGY
jgi:Zn-dependent protease